MASRPGATRARRDGIPSHNFRGILGGNPVLRWAKHVPVAKQAEGGGGASEAERTERCLRIAAIKRPIDVAAAAVVLILTAPLTLLAALLVRATMGRPVLFRQERAGLDGAVFDVYKFRTMRAGSAPDQARLTTLGRFLRTSSIDELPQLWNVLRGEMSLVGPRPLMAGYLRLYSPRQMRRHQARPGITGWAQVRGRNSLEWRRRFELDLWYIDHWSLWLDLKILALTAWRLLRPANIRQAGHATMEPFEGDVSGDSLVPHA